MLIGHHQTCWMHPIGGFLVLFVTRGGVVSFSYLVLVDLNVTFLDIFVFLVGIEHFPLVLTFTTLIMTHTCNWNRPFLNNSIQYFGIEGDINMQNYDLSIQILINL